MMKLLLGPQQIYGNIILHSYLDIDEKVQKVFGRHDNGGVEWDDIALVQKQIQVSSQPLRKKEYS